MKRWYEEKNAPQPGQYLCDVAEVPEGVLKRFEFGESKKTRFKMFLYRFKGELRGYMNVCPHFNVALNVLHPDDVFTSDRQQFMCVMHYAKFEIETGLCIEGPCMDLSMELIPIEVRDDSVYVTEYN